MIYDSIIVGAGILGATVARSLTVAGGISEKKILLLDAGRPMSGTRPSGGHLKPSWFGGMKKEEYKPAMELLDQVWGLYKAEFVVRPMGITTAVYRVDTDLVLATPKTSGNVVSINNLDSKMPEVVCQDHSTYRAFSLIIATGCWVKELLPEFGPKLTAKQGVSFRAPATLETPFIKAWAPYKQIVAHQQTKKTVWIGDGSALLAANWKPERTEECAQRCRKSLIGYIREAAAPSVEEMEQRIGLRPYVETKSKDPCYFRKLGPAAWVVTGAGKSGTISAGWAARRILHDLCG